MQVATVPFLLASSEHAFTLDTGETAVVTVQPQPYGPADTTVNVLIAARLVDPVTGATELVGASSVQAPGASYSILAATLANGADLSAIVADGMQAQAQRARGMRAALQSLHALAPTPAPSSTPSA